MRLALPAVRVAAGSHGSGSPIRQFAVSPVCRFADSVVRRFAGGSPFVGPMLYAPSFETLGRMQHSHVAQPFSIG